MDMDRVTVLKIAFALAGVGIFAYGVRSEDSVVRWVGIAFVIAAFLLRFAKKRRSEEP
jgi:Na+(H+)/acetate symporter ActP